MTENVKENTPIIRVKELEKYFLCKKRLYPYEPIC